MADVLPEPIDVASYLVSDFADKLPRAVESYRFLMSLDSNFGGHFVMLPAGTASGQSYIEARASYVVSNFLATVVLAQGFLENLLGGHLILQESIQPIHGTLPRESGQLHERPRFKMILEKAVEDGLISSSMIPRIEKLIDMRNPLIHHRAVSDPSHLMRRAMAENISESDLLEEDAKFAISLIVEIAHTAMQNMMPHQ